MSLPWPIRATILKNKSWSLPPDPAEDISAITVGTVTAFCLRDDIHLDIWCDQKWSKVTIIFCFIVVHCIVLEKNHIHTVNNLSFFFVLCKIKTIYVGSKLCVAVSTQLLPFVRLNLGASKNQLTSTDTNTHKHLAHLHVCNLLHSANTHMLLLS